jgi:Na+-translocating ferredoxin:NAD+ oxidoreductase RnfD subunit
MAPDASSTTSHAPPDSHDPAPPPHRTAARVARLPNFTGDDLTHSGVAMSRYISMHVLGALFPVTAGLMLYGWRAAGAMVLVVGSAGIAASIWRHIGLRGGRLRIDHTLWMALLLALMLPAHLASTHDPVADTNAFLWPMLPASGIVLVILMWALGGAGAGRIHPVLIAYLLLCVLFQDFLTPRYTLRREHAFGGDVLDAPGGAKLDSRVVTTRPSSLMPIEPIQQSRPAWIAAPLNLDQFEATRTIPAAERLESFTAGHQAPERAFISLESLVRDRLPPLEDLIVGGQPAAVGLGSAIALIIGGLFLLYRGLIDYRVPLLIFTSAFVCFLILPVPVVITESARISRWFALRDSSVGLALGVTFANYELMASPLLFMGFFLATAPAVRPLVRRARAIYALLVGVATALFQLYVSVTIGPYLALLGISLLSPTLDRMFRPRALV